MQLLLLVILPASCPTSRDDCGVPRNTRLCQARLALPQTSTGSALVMICLNTRIASVHSKKNTHISK
eukprot:m.130796 g.130796  ORF g.130796 m.130796 type:complete len:67 (+) comp9794_c0_seq1:1137-1337(+)